MRCTCADARAAELEALAETFSTMADRPDVVTFATPYVSGTLYMVAKALRARAFQIRDEGITPRIREFRATRNPFDMP